MLYRQDGEAQHAKEKAYGPPGSKKAGNSVVSNPRFFSYKVEQRLHAFDFCPSTPSLLKLEGGRSFHDKNMWER